MQFDPHIASGYSQYELLLLDLIEQEHRDFITRTLMQIDNNDDFSEYKWVSACRKNKELERIENERAESIKRLKLKSKKATINVLFSYLGGKSKHSNWITKHFPAHVIYVEPFGGSGAMLTYKGKSYAEVYNDRNKHLVSLFKHLQDPVWFEQMVDELSKLAWDLDDFRKHLRFLGKDILTIDGGLYTLRQVNEEIKALDDKIRKNNNKHDILRRRELVDVASKIEVSGKTISVIANSMATATTLNPEGRQIGQHTYIDDEFSEALGLFVTQKLGSKGRGAQSSMSFKLANVGKHTAVRKEDLEYYSSRFKDVYVTCKDWESVLTEYDSSETFFYLDPPYHPAFRTQQSKYGDYAHEMSADDHHRLIDMLLDLDGMAILSGYDATNMGHLTAEQKSASDEYARLTSAGWRTAVKHTVYLGKKRTEKIWISPSAVVQRC
ncbi:DNA adenine methylase [Acidithiobacillus ferrivorans]|nr:DNA adenine methylase [Acidithiobacillus ferrivorans]